MRPDVPTANADFLAPSFRSDPYPVLGEIRALGPVSFHEEFGQFATGGRRDCARDLGDPEMFVADPSLFLSLFGGHAVESVERQRHDLVRSIWAPDLVRVGRQATNELNEYLRQATTQPRVAGQDDVIGRMVVSPIAQEHMTEGEVVATPSMSHPGARSHLVFAGDETTAKLMSYIVLALALHPDVPEDLRWDRAFIPQTAEQVHRRNPISRLAWRTLRGPDVTSWGRRFESGSVLMLRTGANRDPARWDSPGNFDIHRLTRIQLGSGFGIHCCLGLNLARVEVRSTIRGPTRLGNRQAA
jgi:cytochrome P450